MIDKSLKNSFEEKGYILLKNFFDKKTLSKALNSIKIPYINQFSRFKLHSNFDENMFKLFELDFETFSNIGKHNQHGNLEIYRLATDIRLVDILVQLGLKEPYMATRPVIMQNHKALSKKEIFYKIPPHQDWGSIRGSKNSVVVWVPLIPIPLAQGPVNFIPGSHKEGLLENNIQEGFTCVKSEEQYFSYQEMELGDILIFSTFLIHKSGEILNDKIRWSCHFRFNDILEQDFVERSYEFNYIYKPKLDV